MFHPPAAMPPPLFYDLSTVFIDHASHNAQFEHQSALCVLDLANYMTRPSSMSRPRSSSDVPQTRDSAHTTRVRYHPIDVESVSDKKMKKWTRFTKPDIRRLLEVLQVPSTIHIPRSRRRFTSVQALVILLSRLVYPSRLADLSDRFGLPESAISECTNELSNLLTEKWAIPLLSFNPEYLTPTRLDLFASIISARGCPMNNIWGFIDATIKMVCRPGWAQRELYSGYAKGHCFKYQAIVTPDGIIACCSLPLPGRRADGACLQKSGVEPLLEKHAYGLDGQRLLMWGDPAYARSEVLASGEKEVGRLSQVDQEFYNEMATFRECVEWSFSEVSNLFAFNNYSSNLKVHLSPIGSYFLSSILFTNAHTCLYGSITSHFYSLNPPSLEEYFVQPSSRDHVDSSLSHIFEYENVDI